MFCDNCGKPAVIHIITLFGNDKQVKKHLCEECAGKALDIKNILQISDKHDLALDKDVIEGLMNAIMEQVKKVADKDAYLDFVTCESCGLSYSELKKTGKFGCTACYRTFCEQLYGLLGTIQERTGHIGKVPKRTGSTAVAKHKIKKLREKLQMCVAEERYEEAAKLRDEINEMVRVAEKNALEVPIDAN